MNVIIVGAGKVGSYLNSKLSDEGHNILVIEKNKEVLERLLSQNDVMGILVMVVILRFWMRLMLMNVTLLLP